MHMLYRFGVLGEPTPITEQSRAGCEAIVKAVCTTNKFLKSEEFVCGKTKIFGNDNHLLSVRRENGIELTSLLVVFVLGFHSSFTRNHLW
jgi:hypothetical protein